MGLSGVQEIYQKKVLYTTKPNAEWVYKNLSGSFFVHHERTLYYDFVS